MHKGAAHLPLKLILKQLPRQLISRCLDSFSWAHLGWSVLIVQVVLDILRTGKNCWDYCICMSPAFENRALSREPIKKNQLFL